jgi:hypothetical protein
MRVFERDHPRMIQHRRAQARGRRDRVQDQSRIVGLAFIEQAADAEPFGAKLWYESTRRTDTN